MAVLAFADADGFPDQRLGDEEHRAAPFDLVAGADHFDFLAPCSEKLARLVPIICRSAPGFDRAAFHANFDAAVVTFFRHTLTAG